MAYASREARAAGAWAHLLLVAVLALGVFAMHTTGHPDPGPSTAHSASAADPSGLPGLSGPHDSAAAATVVAGMSTAGTNTTGTSGVGTSGTGASTASINTVGTGAAAPGDGVTADDGANPAHGTGMAMDMTSLCVAVLGGFILAALLRTALGRRADWQVALRAGTVPSLRRGPPPRGPDLTRLSILRI